MLLGVSTDVTGDHDETEHKADRLEVGEPESDETRPLCAVREEGEACRGCDADKVAKGAHDDAGVGEPSREPAGTDDADHLEDVAHDVQKGDLKIGKAHVADDDGREVGEYSGRDGSGEGGGEEEPGLGVEQG